MSSKRVKQINKKTKQYLSDEIKKGTASYIIGLQSGTLSQRFKKCFIILFKLKVKK